MRQILGRGRAIVACVSIRRDFCHRHHGAACPLAYHEVVDAPCRLLLLILLDVVLSGVDRFVDALGLDWDLDRARRHDASAFLAGRVGGAGPSLAIVARPVRTENA